MDFKIVWTLRSREDLRDLATFISKDNPPAALKLGEQIFARGGHAFNMGNRSQLTTVKNWPQRLADWLNDSQLLKPSLVEQP